MKKNITLLLCLSLLVAACVGRTTYGTVITKNKTGEYDEYIPEGYRMDYGYNQLNGQIGCGHGIYGAKTVYHPAQYIVSFRVEEYPNCIYEDWVSKSRYDELVVGDYVRFNLPPSIFGDCHAQYNK